ncbi:MAG TPA: septum site-determining protein MinC [Candidatus Acidoferrales bacterium]|nr:septum site-determining protein MinC [Candidatus Acidoferrales bacterium]
MSLLRGRGHGLEVHLAGWDFDAAIAELTARLSERPEFYRGTRATVRYGETPLDAEQLEALRGVLAAAGIELTGVELPSAGEELARRRALRPKRELKLSDAARSLVADFAGARSDIAERRKRGESSVRRVNVAAAATSAAALQVAPPPPPGTLYHVGTLRGGQALHHAGNIVVVGDANPGTELVATGDIVVFGRLLGVAHAGAQGDSDAKVYALHLQATQLRIATCIALDEERSYETSEPEVAFVRDGRITIAPFSKAAEVAG